MKKLIISIFFVFTSGLFAQSDLTVKDENYKFEITFPSGWKNSRTEETDKKDVINYSFQRKDNKIAVSIIAFKIEKPKSIDDIIYTLEKDFSLSIPEKTGGYTDISGDKYTGKYAEYKDNDNNEQIYYLTTTVDSGGLYYSYMVRFICDAKQNFSDLKSEINKIYTTFKINI
jgi:hypothetical protein